MKTVVSANASCVPVASIAIRRGSNQRISADSALDRFVTPFFTRSPWAAPVAFKINPDEVDEAFEVPFAFLMNAANHTLRHEELEGKLRHFHAMPYGARNIWDVTAGILRNLYERLYS